jgi:hypothetical protein
MLENLSGIIMEMVKLDSKVIPAELSTVNSQLVELNAISRSLMFFAEIVVKRYLEDSRRI